MTPAGDASEGVVGGTHLTALARRDNWFLVMLDGAGRWASARFVNMEGGCH